MYRKVVAFSAVLLLCAAGALWATSNTWTWPVPTGGTQLTTGDVIYARDANNLGNISPSTAGQALVSAGASTAPAFGNVSLTAGVTGTLAATNGGTGSASYTTGDMLYASSATAIGKLTAVATGQLLASAGTNTAPAYTANPTITGYYAGAEMTPPAAPSANGWRLYASDVGGKTTLYVIFASGAAQAVATQP